MSENFTLYSKMLPAKSRRYFFDVYEGSTGKRLVMKESRLYHGREYAQRLTVFENDLETFVVEFFKMLGAFDLDGDRIRRAFSDHSSDQGG